MNQTQIKRNEIFEKIKNIKNHVKNITKKRRENIINNYSVKNVVYSRLIGSNIIHIISAMYTSYEKLDK